ncbi:MAG TPA: ribbon-helix-helix domain-containing protein [Pyrinomonadaceae bacterium]|nr:ribbon-helix-helix domain-containing protein [Pyrinomonadaceae bacterium]
MGTSTINISIPDTLKVQVDEAIATDGYGNTSEFFRDLARDYLKRRQQARLEAMLLEGLQSEFTPWTRQDVEEIKKRGLQRLEEIRKSR